MSVLSYLEDLASAGLLREREREKNMRSARTLEQRLLEHFGDQVTDAFPFGSSIRGTRLPQFYSETTDIDYIVVFRNDGRTSGAYLQRLLTFGDQWYPRSPVRQAAPAVVIELAHVTFELVPALPAFLNDYKIPTTTGGWQGANPKGLEQALMRRNVACDGMLKPAIRLVKLWNTEHDYLFDSFDLERQAVDFSYPFAANVRDYFFAIVKKLDLDPGAARWRHDRLAQARQTIKTAMRLEAAGDNMRAIQTIAALFP